MPAPGSKSRGRAWTRPAEGIAPQSMKAGIRIPFNCAEEGWQLIDPPDETANIQLEVRVAGVLEEEELRRAIATAVAAHPMTRARKVARRFLLRPPHWEIGEPESGGILRVIRCEDESELTAARVAFYDRPIDLGRAPALHCLLAHCPGGDVLMLNIHHAITDGMGAVRFLHSLSRAYHGRPDPASPVDLMTVRDVKTYFTRDTTRRTQKVGPPRIPTGARAFIAREGGRDGTGYGFHHVTLMPEQCRALNPRRFDPSATINDLLLASLHRTIAGWNACRDQPRECITVYMPVNFRPAAWRHEVVANLTGGGKVATMPDQRTTAEALMASVAAQTRWIKHCVADAKILALPRWVLGLLPVLLPLLFRLLGDRIVHTGVLSNLGRLDDVPDFGSRAGEVTGIWFSPPCAMPTGLAVGAIGLHGRLHLTFRYRRALFDDDAARRFTDLFLDSLAELSDGVRSARNEWAHA